MKRVSAQYLAGFFDGEGCVSITGKKPHLQITISQKNPKVLHLIQKSLKIGKVWSRDTKWGKTHQLKIDRHEDQRKFIEIILPYSIVKRKHLEVALDFLSTIAGPWEVLSPEVISKREQLAGIMKSLNKRSKPK